MAAGAADAWACGLAKRFGRLDGPVWIAFHHEPETDGPIQDWRRMQEHLAPIVRSQDNLAFTVIVTGWHQFYGEEQYRLANIWPRGVKVDVAGFDIYNQLGVVKDGEDNTKGTDLDASYFSKIEPWARRHDVAWGSGGDRVHPPGGRGRPALDPSYPPTARERRRRGVHVLQHDAEQHRPVGPVHGCQAGRVAGSADRRAAPPPLSPTLCDRSRLPECGGTT